MDRRANSLSRDYIKPVLVSLIVGACSTFATMKVALAVMENEVANVKIRVIDLVSNLEKRVERLENESFTKNDLKLFKYDILNEIHKNGK